MRRRSDTMSTPMKMLPHWPNVRANRTPPRLPNAESMAAPAKNNPMVRVNLAARARAYRP